MRQEEAKERQRIFTSRLSTAKRKVGLLQEIAARHDVAQEEHRLRDALAKLEKRRSEGCQKLSEALAAVYRDSSKFSENQVTTLVQNLERLCTQAAGGGVTTGQLLESLESGAAAVLHRGLDDRRERVRALGITTKGLQAQLADARAEGKAVVSELTEGKRDAFQASKSTLRQLKAEVDSLAKEIRKETENGKKEGEKLGKYRQVIEQARQKLHSNEKKVAGLRTQLRNRQEEHVELQNELDQMKKAEAAFGQGCDVQVLAAVEVPNFVSAGGSSVSAGSAPPAGGASAATFNSTKDHDHGYVGRAVSSSNTTTWCLLKEPPCGGAKRKHGKVWWTREQLAEVTSSTAVFPDSLQEQFRACLSSHKAALTRSEEALSERQRFLDSLVGEYEKYRKKAETVARLQDRNGSPVEKDTLERLQQENQEVRAQVSAVSTEIRGLQQSNGQHHAKVLALRSDILRICDSLAQKSSQRGSFEKKLVRLRAEVSEKDEERELLTRFADEGRKKALDQEVDILRTLEKNLQMECKTLKSRLEAATAPNRSGEADDRAGNTVPQVLDADVGATAGSASATSDVGTPRDRSASTDTPPAGPDDEGRAPSAAWSEVMELRSLLRQYEQAVEQEERDEELLRQQNEHILAQLQDIYACCNLKGNMGQRVQLEYIRNVFRQVLSEEAAHTGEHEQCVAVLLEFLEFDIREQDQIRKKRQAAAASPFVAPTKAMTALGSRFLESFSATTNSWLWS
ncbi:unnamed protein product [Amoebophrya sp. A25]|nr:unnamed protein product [Amoebophrya sp. A25]|eukprot:GSA25T00014146001.1